MNQQYDPIVENIYLSAVNDSNIHPRCIEIIAHEKTLNQLVPLSILKSRFRRLQCSESIHTLSDRQWRLIWTKIKTHLSDYTPYFFPLEHSYLTTDEKIKFKDICSEANLYQPKPLETQPMNELAKTPIKSITYIFGNDISKADENTLMTLIKRAKNEIRDLEEVGVESTHITAKIASLNTAITAMIERLDSFEV